MDVYPFDTLYIADLNGIQSIENTSISHRTCIDEIHASYPGLTIWIDAGINSLERAMEWSSPKTQLILGSEAFVSLAEFQQLTSALNSPFHLSLDFIGNHYTGPQALLESPQLWPDKVISMTLANVGANQGANQKLIMELLKKAKQSAIYAAGGVRNIQDLHLLKTIGTTGALIASALHNKQITRVDLEALYDT